MNAAPIDRADDFNGCAVVNDFPEESHVSAIHKTNSPRQEPQLLQEQDVQLAQSQGNVEAGNGKSTPTIDVSDLLTSSSFEDRIERAASVSGCVLTVRKDAANSCLVIGNEVFGTAATITELDLSYIRSIILQDFRGGGSINFLGENDAPANSFTQTFESCNGDIASGEIQSGALFLLDDESWQYLSNVQPEEILLSFSNCKGS